MPSLLPSILRTFVPIFVGLIVSVGIFSNIDQTALAELVTAAITAGYYLIARLLEHYVSGSFGWLLGWPAVPTYHPTRTEAGYKDAK